MKATRLITSLAAALLAVTGAMADDDVAVKENPWFVQGGLGASYSVGGGAGLGEMLSPAGQIAVGKQFNPYISARITAGGWRGRYHNPGRTCKGFYHFDFTLDGMWNIFQTIKRDETRPVDLSLIVGAGFDRSFARPASSLLVRAGLQMDVRLCDAVDFNVEYQANGVSDRWNSLDDHSFDTFMNLLVGVTYKFGTGYKCKSCVTPVKVVNDKVNTLREIVEVEKIVHDTVTVVKEVVKKVIPESITRNVYFPINRTEVGDDQMQSVLDVVDFVKAHKGAVVTVAGYADKGTGTVDINLRLARERAENVAALLADKYGIARDHIEVEAMTNQNIQQPFAANDMNRAVIITAYEQ